MNSDLEGMTDERRWKTHSDRKVIPPEFIEKHVKKLRDDKKTIATINGSFDLLHAGHLFMLFEAKSAADVLIVALNTDASIKAYKSPDRPLFPLKERIEMLSAIEYVDYITWFDETDPRAILEKIKPDVHVNGIEYGENCVEAAVVKKNGGKLLLLPRIGSLSTTDLIQKIKRLKQ